uniref:Uncharacterized protein n=1 Tax=viral metagenome TaxID=1070528 RepID=A0A6M3X402_9ZZZZ
MLPITAAKFDKISLHLKLEENMRDALRGHLVDGLPIVDMMAKYRVSQSGFYAAAARLQNHMPERKLKRIVLMVPEERADELRAKVAWQIAQWEAESEPET